jgi:hypothetical protein
VPRGKQRSVNVGGEWLQACTQCGRHPDVPRVTTRIRDQRFDGSDRSRATHCGGPLRS